VSIRRLAPVSVRRGGPPAAGAFKPVISSYLPRAYAWRLFRIRNKRHYSGRRIIPQWHPVYGKNTENSVTLITGRD